MVSRIPLVTLIHGVISPIVVILDERESAAPLSRNQGWGVLSRGSTESGTLLLGVYGHTSEVQLGIGRANFAYRILKCDSNETPCIRLRNSAR